MKGAREERTKSWRGSGGRSPREGHVEEMTRQRGLEEGRVLTCGAGAGRAEMVP